MVILHAVAGAALGKLGVTFGAALAAFAAGFGIGKLGAAAMEAIARQPEAKGDINKALLLGCALAEATAIYGFVIAILIILFLK